MTNDSIQLNSKPRKQGFHPAATYLLHNMERCTTALPMSSLIDLTGKRFGRLIVLSRAETLAKRTRWFCKCDCGTEKPVLAQNLTHPHHHRRIYSCGCQGRENRRKAATSHGMSRSLEIQMLWNAKKRAKSKGLPFALTLADIRIPKRCPYLGISIHKVGKVQTANSPALDRIDSAKGYTPDNVQVISNRANTMKHDATFEEFQRMYFAWKAAL